MLTKQEGCLTTQTFGAIVKDLGYALWGAQMTAGNDITGLFDFRQSPTVKREFATLNNAADTALTLWGKTPAGAWTNIAGATAPWTGFQNCKVEMTKFLDYCFFVGHDATQGFLPKATVTGTTFSETTNATDMAQGKYILRYRSRVYVLNCRSGGTDHPYRVYFSSTPSAGSITWTPATDFFDVDEGEDITGGIINWDRMLIFTLTSTYFYDQTQAKQIWDYGCSNHRTAKNFGAFTIWCTGDDVVISTGGQPQPIGGEYKDFIQAGNSLNYFAERIDNEYHLYIGTVTVKDTTYTNTVLTYNFGLDTWRLRELAHSITVFSKYLDTTTGKWRLHMGNADGGVYDKTKYTDTLTSSPAIVYADAGSAINSRFEITINLGNMTIEKVANNLVAYANRAGGLKLKGRVVDRNQDILMPYQSIGELTQYVNSFQLDVGDGALLQIEGVQSGTTPYWSFYGFELEVNKSGNVLQT